MQDVCRWQEHNQHKMAKHSWNEYQSMQLGYSGNQPLRMVKYHWQTEGIKFIIITKQTFTKPNRLWKSLSNCHGMLWSPQYSHQRQHEIVAASPYCLSFCTKQNQKHASLSSITSSLMYVYPLYCMFHSVCLPSSHMFHDAVCPLPLVPELLSVL
jgi:hypothetical protein